MLQLMLNVVFCLKVKSILNPIFLVRTSWKYAVPTWHAEQWSKLWLFVEEVFEKLFYKQKINKPLLKHLNITKKLWFFSFVCVIQPVALTICKPTSVARDLF